MNELYIYHIYMHTLGEFTLRTFGDKYIYSIQCIYIYIYSVVWYVYLHVYSIF